MKIDFRSGTTQVLLLAGGAGCVMLAAVLFAPSSEQGALPLIGEEDADSSYANVSYQIYDIEGLPHYTVRTRQIDQYLDAGEAALRDPHVRWQGHDLEGSWATAMRGMFEDDDLRLKGAVEVFLQPENQEHVLIHSHDLKLDNVEQSLRSSSSITSLVSGATQIRGRNLDWNLAAGTGVLRTDIRSRHYLGLATSDEYPSLLKRLLEFSLPSAQAETPDVLEVEADKIEWDTPKRKAYYEGDVIAQRGDLMDLRAERVTLILGTDDNMDSLHANGNTQFTHRLPSGNTLRARAQRIDYYPREQKVEMNKSVTLTDGTQEYSGEHLVYLIGEERVSSAPSDDGTPRETGRVRIRIPLGDDAP